MKKKIAILTRRMDIGGVEISLLNFIKALDKNKYEVTLILKEKHGVLLSQIPNDIQLKIIKFDGIEYLKFTELDMKLPILKEVKFKILMRIYKLLYKNTDHSVYYGILKHSYIDDDTYYDLAIDYHGYGYFTTLFMCHKVRAKKYITFIHDDKIDWMKNIRSLMDKIDCYFCVSKACKNHVAVDYPQIAGKLKVFYNIIDIDTIMMKSMILQNDIPKHRNNVLVTVGRLEWQKGYDLLLDAAKILRDKKIVYTWYIIGSGSWYELIVERINKENLNNYVCILGEKDNPYPYVKRADIYIQTSRHEGYGIAICEAKILCRPIISTDLPCVREQIEHKKNGILCELNADSVADSIIELLNNEELRNSIIKHLTENPIGFENQMILLDNMAE